MNIENEYWYELGNLFTKKAISKEIKQEISKLVYSRLNENTLDLNSLTLEENIALLELMLQNKIEDNREILKKSERFIDNIDVKYLISAIYFINKEYDKALEIINELLKITDNVEAMNLKAMILWKTRRFGEFEYTLDQALLLEPENKKLLFNKGLFALEIEDYVSAANAFKRILELEPEHAPALLRMANVVMQSQRVDNVNYETAIDLLNKALRISPHNPEILEDLGIALFNSGKISEAEKKFQELIDTEKSESAWYYLGLAAFSRGNTKQAMALFSKAIEINSENADLWYYKGLAAMYSNENEIAKHCLQKALELDPSLVEAQDFLKMLK